MAITKLSGPAFVPDTAGNLYVPSSSLLYGIVNQIDLTNVSGADVTVTTYVGATSGSASGTQTYTVSVPAGTTVPKYYSPGLKLSSTQFLTGIAGTASAVTYVVMGSEENVPR